MMMAFQQTDTTVCVSFDGQLSEPVLNDPLYNPTQSQEQSQLCVAVSCTVCGESFAEHSELMSHMVIHSNEKHCVCPVCNKEFKTERHLKRHSNSHSETPRFCCNICGKGFKYNDVAKHRRRFHTKSQGSLQENTQQYGSKQGVVLSSKQTVDQVNAEYPSSQHEIIQAEGEGPKHHDEKMEHKPVTTDDHQSTQHGSLHVGMSNIDLLPCTQRDSIIVGSKSMDLVPCDKCNGNFFTVSGLASHMKTHQQSNENVKGNCPKKSKHYCHLCEKTFTRAFSLNVHLKSHSGLRVPREPNPDFRCNECGKEFTRRSGLNAHVLQHGGVLRFWCDEPDCGKGFVLLSQVKRHKRCHSEVFPYKCHVCGRCFRHNDLTKHMRTHTGDKPFNCQHCGKAFSSTSSCRAHERMHNEAYKFVCEICRESFTTSIALKKHIKSHEEASGNPCSLSGEQFPSEVELNIHLRESQCALQNNQLLHQDLETEAIKPVQVQQSQQLQVQSQLHQEVHAQQLYNMHEMQNV